MYGDKHELERYDASERAALSAAYLMVKSIHFNDFKCFRDLKLEGLRRVNILVGESGSGKTAFLEAMFMAAGASAELYFRTRRWRGFSESIEISSNAELHEAIGRDIFHVDENGNLASSAYLRFADSENGPRVLRILRRSGGSEDLLMEPSSSDIVTRPILFQWKIGNRTFESAIQATKDGIKIKAHGRNYPATLISPSAMYQRDNARRFSALSRRSAHLPLVEAIKEVYPRISDLSLELNLGQLTLHASIEGMAEKLPLPAISSGLNKWISIAVAIVSQPRGLVLIDEVENGFYYESLRPLLRSLYKLALDHEVQLVASTHSYEFLEAIASVMREHHGDFALLRFTQAGLSTEASMVTGLPGIEAIGRSFEVR